MRVLLKNNRSLQDLADRYHRFEMDSEARMAYDDRMKFLHDQASLVGRARRRIPFGEGLCRDRNPRGRTEPPGPEIKGPHCWGHRTRRRQIVGMPMGHQVICSIRNTFVSLCAVKGSAAVNTTRSSFFTKPPFFSKLVTCRTASSMLSPKVLIGMPHTPQYRASCRNALSLGLTAKMGRGGRKWLTVLAV